MSSQSAATPPVTDPASEVDGDSHRVGVDLGVKHLLVAAPATAGPEVTNALVVGEGIERDLYDALGDTLNRIADRPLDTSAAEVQTIESYHTLLRQRFALAAAALVDYVDHHGVDIVAIEDREFKERSLATAARSRTKAGEWILPAFRDRLEAMLAAEGYRVERVDTAYTTQECHICGELVEMSRATIVCETEECPVGRICRDRSAAVSIAQRARKDERQPCC